MHQVWHGHKCRNAEQSEPLVTAEAPAAAENLQTQTDFLDQTVSDSPEEESLGERNTRR